MTNRTEPGQAEMKSWNQVTPTGLTEKKGEVSEFIETLEERISRQQEMLSKLTNRLNSILRETMDVPEATEPSPEMHTALGSRLWDLITRVEKNERTIRRLLNTLEL